MNRISTLQAEALTVRAAVETFETAAKSEARDLSEIETVEVDALLTRSEEIDAELEPLIARQAKTDALLAKVRPANIVVRGEAAPEAVTMGQYMSALIGSAQGVPADVTKFRSLAEDYMADVPGLIPVPVINSVINRYDVNRPVFASFTPAGSVPSKTFEQPAVTQHVAVDTQAAEGDEVASQKLTVSNYTITASTLAGAVILSNQVVDWSSPSALQLISDDFAKVYTRRTEVKASAALVAAATENVAWNTTSIATTAASLQGAILALEDNLETVDTSKLVLYLSPDQYAAHFALFTAEGVAFVNAIPNFPKVVRGRFLGAYGSFLADTSAIRVWETKKGLAQLMRISTLEYELGYSGYIAFDFAAGSVVDLSHAGS